MPARTAEAPMNNDIAAIARLDIRTTGLEREVNDLRSTVNGMQSALSSEIRGVAATLSGKIDERGRPQWAIYIAGIMMVFSMYAYIDNSKIGPLKEKDADIVSAIKEMAANVSTNMVPIRQHVREWEQNDTKFKTLETSIEDRVKRLDDRSQHDRQAIIDRIKRVEELFGNSYNIRDAIQQMDARIQHFERSSTERK